MARYHINPASGNVGKCSAQPGNCPFGAEAPHYGTHEEAAKASEKVLASNSNALSGTTKAPKPATAMTTVVPERQFGFESNRVPTYELKTGDFLLLAEGKGKVLKEHRITSLKRGTKYLTVTAYDVTKNKARDHLFPLGTSVEASVRVETAASKKARAAAAVEQTYEARVKAYQPKREAVAAEINERVAQGHALQSHHIDKLVTAEAKDSVMKIFTSTADEEIARGESSNPYTKAYEDCKSDFERHVLQASTRGNNQNSSAASNLFERARTSAQAEFVTYGPF